MMAQSALLKSVIWHSSYSIDKNHFFYFYLDKWIKMVDKDNGHIIDSK